MTPPAALSANTDPPIEANPVREIAPNEANPRVQATSSTHSTGTKVSESIHRISTATQAESGSPVERRCIQPFTAS